MEAKEVWVAEPKPSVFQNKNFLLLWGAALLSSFGISFFLFSQSWYVVNVLGLEASLGWIYVASSIPRLLFMIISGTVADRFSKTKIMFLSDMIRGLLLIGLVIWFFTGGITVWTFVGFAFLFGILDAFFWAAEGAIVPTIIHRDNLTRGNSIIQMTNQTSFILAPMFAGVMIAFGGYEVVFGMTAVMLLLASVLVYLMRVPATNQDDGNEQKFWDSFKDGLDYVRQSRVLTLLLLTSVFMNLFLVGPMTMGLPLFAKTILQGSALDFSLLEAGLAVGMLVGSVAIGVININEKRGKIAIVAVLIGGVMFAGLSLTTTLWLSITMLGLFGLTLSFSNIPAISAIQSMVEEKMIGRVMGLLSLASMGLIPVSYALTSIVLSYGIPINTIMLCGSLLVVGYASFVFIKFKELRELN